MKEDDKRCWKQTLVETDNLPEIWSVAWLLPVHSRSGHSVPDDQDLDQDSWWGVGSSWQLCVTSHCLLVWNGKLYENDLYFFMFCKKPVQVEEVLIVAVYDYIYLQYLLFRAAFCASLEIVCQWLLSSWEPNYNCLSDTCNKYQANKSLLWRPE